ncbi:MAG: ribosome small subunit-dependent GTPase A [Oscillospiraceae bacterium]|nr:ribosome small subunit-dependent GTPase A [Oscillospiraceae bacterium]
MIEMIDLKQYGYIETETPPDGLLPGRVTEHRGAQYTVVTGRGEAAAGLKGAFYHRADAREDFPCVGDFVLLQYNELGDSQIAALLPRRSKFSRADFSGHAAGYAKTILEQVVAANFDYVFIQSSLNWDFKVSRITRYLTQARQSGGQPVVILTKADLVEDYSAALVEVKNAAPDVPVHAVSAHTGYGVDELGEYLQPGKTVVFLGMSGVGKSSLLNALMNEEVMVVKAIREDDSRGRHTTTHRQLFMLPSGAMVIDTPGMRELGLFGADEGISVGYNDVEDLFLQCRFTNCRHNTEPGCAVHAALDDGSLPRERWERYLAQKRENKFVDDKSGYLQGKRAWNKDLARWSKQQKKSGGIRK